MFGTLKVGAIIGASYAAGSIGGAKAADALGVTSPGARAGVKVGTGVVVFLVLSSVLS